MRHFHHPGEAAQWLRAQVQAAAEAAPPGGPGAMAEPAHAGTLRSDSRQVRAGDAFLAWPGAATDARLHVPAALQAGAAACLVEADGVAAFGLPDDPRLATLTGLKAATGDVAAAFHGRPGDALDVLAVTGTNGKSSTAWWLAQALAALGRRCAVAGTLGIGEPPTAAQAAVQADALGSVASTGLTTPDPVTLHAALRAMVDDGVSACAIEASSIGLAEHRLAGLPVRVALFTNFTRDHLDYHGDMDAYWACKRALFAWPGLRAAVVNIDDAQGAELARELERTAGAGAPALWTVSASVSARLHARDVRYVSGGLAFEVVEGDHSQPVRSTLIGDYNVSNLLGVIGGLRALGIPLPAAAQAVCALSAVPGRMQPVSLPATVVAVALPQVVVDYAHTPDALEKALGALRPLAGSRGGRLWSVFGCGGNRDATKRPLMGAIAQRLADVVVVTSDNPRDEAPETIVAQIVAGMSLADPATAAAGSAAHGLRRPVPMVQIDRRLAIERAVLEAAAADVILVAGKGHETTQEIRGIKHPFVDAQVAARALMQREAACA